MVELGLNRLLWHLDVLATKDVPESEQCWRRFLLARIEHVIAQIAEQKGCEFRLSVQATIDGQRETEYSIRKVRKIIEGTTLDGHTAYVVTCFDGTTIVQPTWKCLEDELLNKHCVYNCGISNVEESAVS